MDLHSFTVGQGDSPWTNKVSRGFFPWLSNSVARRYFTVSAARMLETLATFACSNMDGNTILEAREPEMCAKASGKAGDTGMAHYFVVPVNGRVNERFREDTMTLVVAAFANQLSAMENLELEIIIVSKLQQRYISVLCDYNVREIQRENIIELRKEEQFYDTTTESNIVEVLQAR